MFFCCQLRKSPRVNLFGSQLILILLTANKYNTCFSLTLRQIGTSCAPSEIKQERVHRHLKTGIYCKNPYTLQHFQQWEIKLRNLCITHLIRIRVLGKKLSPTHQVVGNLVYLPTYLSANIRFHSNYIRSLNCRQDRNAADV